MHHRLLLLPVALLIACSGGEDTDTDSDTDVAPIVATAEITPAQPCTTDGLLATGFGGEVLGYKWFRNDAETSVTVDYVDAANTRKGEVWRVEVEVEGAAEPGVAEVTIVNCGPLISTVTLEPEVPFADTAIVATVDAFDPDEDRLTFAYTWFVDGEPLDEVAGSRLLPGNFARGQEIFAEVIASDGELESTPRRSNTVVPVNSPPTAPRISVDPGAPNDIQDMQCIIVSPSTDADGDPISYRFEWYVDGERSFEVLSRAYTGDTTPARSTAPEQTWECVVIANDGFVDSEAGRISVTIERAVALPGTAAGDLVRVTADTFSMGCVDFRDDIDEDLPCDRDERFADELPDHRVNVSRDMWVTPGEITQAQWDDALLTSPSFHGDCGEDCPVESINWYEALRFANRMSELDELDACYRLTGCTGTLGGGCAEGVESCVDDTFVCTGVSVTAAEGDVTACTGYRLPTEAEWEFMGRAGISTAYPGSRALENLAWYAENSEGAPHPTCEKDTNGNRLCDVAGNVREWTWDWYAADTYPDTLRVNPMGPEEGELRVCRGGDYTSDEVGVRLAKRDAVLPAQRSNTVGFRLVRSIVR